MGELAGCNISFSEKSLVYPLYKEMRAKGRTCRELDVGHCVLDYSTLPGSCKITDANDGVVGEREVLDAAFEDWKKFKEPIEKFLHPVSPFGFLGDHLRWAKAKMVLPLLHSEISSKKMTPDDPKLKEMKAWALYFFTSHPSKEDKKNLGRVLEKKVADDLNALKNMGLPLFSNYLKENGGMGGIFHNSHQLSKNKPNMYGVGFPFHDNLDGLTYFLLHLLQEVGLSPRLLNVLHYRYVPYRCGQPVVIISAVGVQIGDKWHIFSAHTDNKDLDAFPFSVTTPRHFFISRAVLIKTLFNSMWDISSTELADGPGAIFAKAFVQARNASSKKSAQKKFGELLNRHKHDPFINYLDFIIGQTLGFKDMSFLNSGGTSSIEYYIRLFKISRNGTPEDMVEAANKMLKADPMCVEAHETLGRAYMEKGLFDKAYLHLSRVEKMIPEPEWATNPFFNRLGNVLFRLGRFKEAIEKYELTLDKDNANLDTKLEATLMIYFAKLKSSAKGDALSFLNRVVALQREAILKLKKDEWEGLVSIYEKQEAGALTGTLSDVEFKHDIWKDKLSTVYRLWGEGFRIHGNHKSARLWYEKSLELKDGSAELYLSLSKVCQRLGAYDAAEEYLKKYREKRGN